MPVDAKEYDFFFLSVKDEFKIHQVVDFQYFLIF